VRTRAVCAALAFAAVPAADAQAAGDPIMPLADVQAGMHCSARSVLRGTDIATFGVDVVDVIAGDKGEAEPFVLVRGVGPAIAATGFGPGFSGSPIYCPDAAGTQRVIGAISESVGEYGNALALATPIERMLGEPVDVPPETRRAPAPALVRSARPLTPALSIGGLAPPIQALVQRAALRAKRVVYAAPAAPRADLFPPQTLQPGSAFSAGLASGDFTAGSIGTIAYVDGDRVWGFGHSLDSAGRRSLLLQDAYVYTVVNNPVGSGDLRTYKYAAPGHDLGTLTSDGVAAVAGRVGALPPRFPLQIVATDLDSGKVRSTNTTIADETAIGLPTGANALTEVGGFAVAQMAYLTLGGLPLRHSGSMCVRIALRERVKPMRFCNTYVGGSGGFGLSEGGGPMIGDFATAARELDAFNFGPLHITGVQVNMKLRRSLRLAYLTRIVKAPLIVRRGRSFRVTLEVQRQNGPKSRHVITIRVPRATPIGPRALSITGTSADTSLTTPSLDEALSAILDLGAGDEEDTDEAGARTVSALAERIADIHREDAVFAAFPPLGRTALDALEEPDGPTGAEAVAQKARPVYRDPQLRIAGERKRRIFVLP
jgi:hypothetical protein